MIARRWRPGWASRFSHLEERFAERECLDVEQLWRQHLPGYPVEAVRAVFEMLEGEGVSAGLLRPADDVEAVLQPPASWNPLAWMLRRAAFEHAVSAIDDAVAVIVPAHERANTFCATLEDLVRVWSRFGASPRSGKTRLLVWTSASARGLDAIGVSEVWTEVDAAGGVLREVGIDGAGTVAYIAPAERGAHRFGLFDLQRIEPASIPFEDEVARDRFEERWLAGTREYGARGGRVS